jgi:hypothetical protein
VERESDLETDLGFYGTAKRPYYATYDEPRSNGDARMTSPEDWSARAVLAELDDGPEKERAIENALADASMEWRDEHPDSDRLWSELTVTERDEFRATLALRNLGVW